MNRTMGVLVASLILLGCTEAHETDSNPMSLQNAAPVTVPEVPEHQQLRGVAALERGTIVDEFNEALDQLKLDMEEARQITQGMTDEQTAFAYSSICSRYAQRVEPLGFRLFDSGELAVFFSAEFDAERAEKIAHMVNRDPSTAGHAVRIAAYLHCLEVMPGFSRWED